MSDAATEPWVTEDLVKRVERIRHELVVIADEYRRILDEDRDD